MLDDLTELKDRIEHLEKRATELELQKKMILEEIKEYGFNSIEELNKGIEKLSKEISERKTEVERLKRNFMKKYKKYL